MSTPIPLSSHKLENCCNSSIEKFKEKIRAEFVDGSGIDIETYNLAIEIVPDLELDPHTGEVIGTPLHEALNWRYTRFRHQARENIYGALFKNEDNSTWQSKLSKPSIDNKKGKQRKYETPKGGGLRAYRPPVGRHIRRLIAKEFGVEVPPWGESFWDWLEEHPEIPIIFTEGGKKALCLLSHGYVAIALYGVNGGYRSKDEYGFPVKPYLIADVARFAKGDREIYLAFDQDESLKAKRQVKKAVNKFGCLLSASGCSVKIIRWNGANGAKGVDDLIVLRGADAFEYAYKNAVPLNHWQILQRLEGQLTYPANIKLTTADLSTLEIINLPDEGIIGIHSAKGTGKTKFTSNIIAHSKKVLATTHRIALTRNLCERFRINYRGDVDKVNGDFISGSGYTLRIGACIDALLAIDPEKFRGCDLILDEVVQVVRHLLTSATCAQDGKRPALLARFRELIQVARRVIIADADLNNSVLNYICELRGEKSAFLIRNDYKPQPYNAKFLKCSDRSFIVGMFLEDVRRLEQRRIIFLQTDTKSFSKYIAKLIQKLFPDKRTLLINSETSGGIAESAFMKTPDAEIAKGEYDIVICSPSGTTGLSIECQGIVKRVYGIYNGTSLIDADMAQGLARVREAVERIIWCAERGRNYCKVSDSINPLQVKADLKRGTDATVSLIRSNLREDTWQDELDKIDYQSDPHINLFCRISADQNFSMSNLREALFVRLQYEGHNIQILESKSLSGVKDLLKKIKEEVTVAEAKKLLAAPDLTHAQIKILEAKRDADIGLQSEELLAIEKYYLKDFYKLETLTLEDILWDLSGRRRGEILNLEYQLYPELAGSKSISSIDIQAKWSQSVCPWDISLCELRRWLRELLGLNDFLDANKEWTRYDLKRYADKIRNYRDEIKQALKITPSEKISDVQLVHQLLSQLGIKIKFRWSRSMPGHEGEKIRVYSLDREHWDKLMSIIERRHTARKAGDNFTDDLNKTGSPGGLYTQNDQGDPRDSKVSGRYQGVDSVDKGVGENHQGTTQLSIIDARRFYKSS